MNQQPIRECILTTYRSLIQKYSTSLIIVNYDAQLIGYRGQLCWAIVTECTGAVIGPDNNLCYNFALFSNGSPTTDTWPPTPRLPPNWLIEHGIRDTCEKLRTMRQLQLLKSQNPNQN